MTILTVITLVLTCAIGIWKFVARLKSERRRLADEAKKKLENAQNPSDFLDAFDRINRV